MHLLHIMGKSFKKTMQGCMESSKHISLHTINWSSTQTSMGITPSHSQHVYGHSAHATQHYVSVWTALELNILQGQCRSYAILS